MDFRCIGIRSEDPLSILHKVEVVPTKGQMVRVHQIKRRKLFKLFLVNVIKFGVEI
jgi:hypothetical protein